MLKTRQIKGQLKFYESTTGITQENIKSVSFNGFPDVVVTLVYKDGVPFVFLPMRDGNPLVSLQYAIERAELSITRVA